MRKLELLAPAKDLACGMAAIDHGADAVYIGAQRFGARAAAGNSTADIARLCDYAHQFGARVYVTVNTIIYDDELADTQRLLEELAEAQADAILVQDMGLVSIYNSQFSIHNSQFSILNSQFPILNSQFSIHNSQFSIHNSQFTLHASTQTDNRTADKVRWLWQQGFSRVVLARELSIDEIAEIHRQVPDVELEVFVHGALCVSYSGLCYASQQCFGRSANRGACAQFCRMKFDLVDADGQVIEHSRHLLSLKDLNQSGNLERLAEAGATSFKIEGRLKDIGYVKNVTAAYSELLNQLVARHPDRYERASLGHCRYTFHPDLRKTFNRGYTTYFANGRQADIASFDTPKAMGEFVGTVKELRGPSFNVAGTASFANGDGLCFLNADRELEGFRVNRVEGNRLFPQKMPQNLRPGLRLYRNNDQQLERLLAKPSAERKIPVAMSLRATDDGFALTMGSVTVTMPAEHRQAEKPQRDNIVRQLTKLGGTPFECATVDMAADFDYFIPSSHLSELRRRATEALLKNLCHRADTSSAPRQHDGDAPPPLYRVPYLYNVSNHLARQFYERQGVEVGDAFELRQPADDALLMQCRHCLRYSLGYCVRRGGQRPPWREPLSLVLGDGRRFRLAFDCKNCQMNIFES